jgi:hypothetical protein
MSMKSEQNANDEKEPNEVPQKHPPKKVTYKIRGQQQMREYYFLKTVKSMEELDKFRFQVRQCVFCQHTWLFFCQQRENDFAFQAFKSPGINHRWACQLFA